MGDPESCGHSFGGFGREVRQGVRLTPAATSFPLAPGVTASTAGSVENYPWRSRATGCRLRPLLSPPVFIQMPTSTTNGDMMPAAAAEAKIRQTAATASDVAPPDHPGTFPDGTYIEYSTYFDDPSQQKLPKAMPAPTIHAVVHAGQASEQSCAYLAYNTDYELSYDRPTTCSMAGQVAQATTGATGCGAFINGTPEWDRFSPTDTRFSLQVQRDTSGLYGSFRSSFGTMHVTHTHVTMTGVDTEYGVHANGIQMWDRFPFTDSRFSLQVPVAASVHYGSFGYLSITAGAARVCDSTTTTFGIATDASGQLVAGVITLLTPSANLTPGRGVVSSISMQLVQPRCILPCNLLQTRHVFERTDATDDYPMLLHPPCELWDDAYMHLRGGGKGGKRRAPRPNRHPETDSVATIFERMYVTNGDPQLRLTTSEVRAFRSFVSHTRSTDQTTGVYYEQHVGGWRSRSCLDAITKATQMGYRGSAKHAVAAAELVERSATHTARMENPEFVPDASRRGERWLAALEWVSVHYNVDAGDENLGPATATTSHATAASTANHELDDGSSSRVWTDMMDADSDLDGSEPMRTGGPRRKAPRTSIDPAAGASTVDLMATYRHVARSFIVGKFGWLTDQRLVAPSMMDTLVTAALNVSAAGSLLIDAKTLQGNRQSARIRLHQRVIRGCIMFCYWMASALDRVTESMSDEATCADAINQAAAIACLNSQTVASLTRAQVDALGQRVTAGLTTFACETLSDSGMGGPYSAAARLADYYRTCERVISKPLEIDLPEPSTLGRASGYGQHCQVGIRLLVGSGGHVHALLRLVHVESAQNDSIH